MRNFVVFVLIVIGCLFSVGATPAGPNDINVTYNDTWADSSSGVMVQD